MRKDGILHNLLDYGDILIKLAAGAEAKSLRYVPNIDYHFRTIEKAKRDYINARLMARHPGDLEQAQGGANKPIDNKTELSQYPIGQAIPSE